MPMIDITTDTFDSVLSEHELLLVDFWAEWCEPCVQMGKVLEKLLEKRPELVIGKINIEAEKELAEEFDVKSVPRLMLIRHKIVLSDETGLMAEGPLLDLIERAEAIEEDHLEQIREGNEEE